MIPGRLRQEQDSGKVPCATKFFSYRLEIAICGIEQPFKVEAIVDVDVGIDKEHGLAYRKRADNRKLVPGVAPAE